MPEEPLEGADLEFGEALAMVMGAPEIPKTASAPGTPAESNPTPVTKTASAPEDPLQTILGMDYEELFKNAHFRQGVAEELEANKHEWEPLLVEYVKGLTTQ